MTQPIRHTQGACCFLIGAQRWQIQYCACAVLGIRLVHSKPYSQGRGKKERANRYIRETFLAEARHHGIESLDQLNDWFAAWTGQLANRRVHAEAGQVVLFA